MAIDDKPDALHVHPGDNIQEAIERAAARASNKVVKVHEGEYRPAGRRPALIWFNRKHDGVRVEAVGRVVLSAANRDLATPGSQAFPAIVNHVIYFGHGVSSNTVLRGFKITGANGFVTEKFQEQMEPDNTVPKNSFWVTDGGGIKVFGASSPTLENLEVYDNFTRPCAGGVSVQQQMLKENPVTFRNCIFRNNRAQVTGCAVDLLEGSFAVLENCLFVGNLGNTGVDTVAKRSGEKPMDNSAALTVFQNSRAIVRKCTFTGNRNGVDDLSGVSVYENSIFYRNELAGGKPEFQRYELDLQKGATVKNCVVVGTVHDPKGALAAGGNRINGDPKFDEMFRPHAEGFEKLGFRWPSN